MGFISASPVGNDGGTLPHYQHLIMKNFFASIPVIDRSAGPSGTIYVVAMSKAGTGQYFQRLHALNLATGAEMFGGPRDIQASTTAIRLLEDGTNLATATSSLRPWWPTAKSI
jgi:hypothetical protein